MLFWKRKTTKHQLNVAQILEEKTGQEAIIEIDNLLSPIFYEKPESLSDEETVIVLVEEYEREINNGGFNQFFYNSAGNDYYEIIDALKKIGSVIFLDILESSSKPFPGSKVPVARNERQRMLEEMGDNAEKIWKGLEEKFYKYEEDITKLLIEYINKNKESFR